MCTLYTFLCMLCFLVMSRSLHDYDIHQGYAFPLFMRTAKVCTLQQYDKFVTEHLVTQISPVNDPIKFPLFSRPPVREKSRAKPSYYL